jgi:hypothetical protein
MEQLDTEVVETVAGVARLLRRAAELVWTQPTQPVPGRRVSYSRWGLILQRMRHQTCCLAAPGGMGRHRLGTTQLTFLLRLSSCCAGSVWWVHHRGCSV